MKHILIDTDTASDDAIALIMALREPKVKVEGITVVAGNVGIEQALENALISVEMADTYNVPVYKGAARPLLKHLHSSADIHGDDGMGNMHLAKPTTYAKEEHAVDAMIRLIEDSDVPMELITIGPLTNVAIACAKAPDVMRKLSKVYVMGGSGLGPGNVTPHAEFNIYADGEAAQMVLEAGLNLYFVGWDVIVRDTFLSEHDIKRLMESDSSIAHFCMKVNGVRADFGFRQTGVKGLNMPDPAAIYAAFYPEIADFYRAECRVEFRDQETYGKLHVKPCNKEHGNAWVCKKIHPDEAKLKLFELLGVPPKKNIL